MPGGGAFEFSTFWHGPLDAMAYSCLASFAHDGADLSVYSYDDGIDLPAGVRLKDARRICPDESLLERYLAAGKPSLAKFADMFRYRLILETGCCWVDTDIICLKKPDFSRDLIVFGLQSNPYGQTLINNAVLKLPADHPLLRALIAKAEEAVDVDQSWGAIGPFLLTELALKAGLEHEARDFFHFYPVEPDDFWRLLLPAYRDQIAAATKRRAFCICGARCSGGPATINQHARRRVLSFTKYSSASERCAVSNAFTTSANSAISWRHGCARMRRRRRACAHDAGLAPFGRCSRISSLALKARRYVRTWKRV